MHRILRALVRLLLRFQITYPTAAQWLKAIYVEVAEREFPVAGKPQSDSRITLLTGVHRKEVRRLREAGPTAQAVPGTVSLGALLVANWIGDARYLDDQGRPRPLPRLARQTDGVSFESLVQSVSKDIRPRVVLDEWLRLGICHVDAQDRVWLDTDAFVPEQGFDEKAYYLGRNVHDHLLTCLHNITSPEPPWIERSVYYDRLTAEDVAQLADYAREKGMEALRAVNRRAMVLQQKSAARSDTVGPRRMNFGVYFYEEVDDESRSHEEGPQ